MVVIHTMDLILLSHVISRLVFRFRLHRHDFWHTLAMVATVLGLFVIHTTEVWLWAATYFRLKVAPSFEDALYLSTASFSILGAKKGPGRSHGASHCAGIGERFHPDRLVDSLSGGRFHPTWPVSRR
jgi:hypothetical protein